MTTTQTATNPARIDANTVRQAAYGEWRGIFARLTIEVPAHAKQHGPCPACGGKDRFRFDDNDGRGSWFCNQCDPHAGDGFALVMNVRGCPFPEALRLVAGVLGLDASTTMDRAALKRERTKREHVRRERARKQEQIGLRMDTMREAEATIAAARGIDISRWSDAQLDAALNRLADAYATLETETPQ